MKNIYREYLYIPKDKHISTKVFTTHVVLSVISVLACTLAMFATSYAWFSVEISSDLNTIAAANYDVEVTHVQGRAVADSENRWTLELSEGNQQIFQIRSAGTAATGYCVVEVDGEAYYTEQIEQDAVLTLGITAEPGTEIAFYPHWGELDDQDVDYDWRYGNAEYEYSFMSLMALSVNEDEENFEPGTFIEGPEMPYLEYQFPQYATLENIATFYAIEMDDILIFNGVDDPEDIEIGDWIDLPYVDEDAEDFVPTPPDIEHIVQEGETIESIAEQYDISIEELIEYNELEPAEIETTETTAETDDPNASEAVETEQTEAAEENETEPDINLLYPLTAGDIIWIPFEATSGYTSSDVVHEEDLPAKEPEEVWTENIISGGILSIEETEQLPEIEEEPVIKLPNGILTSNDDERNNDSVDNEEVAVTETPEEQFSGVLTPGGLVSTDEEPEVPDNEETLPATSEQEVEQRGILTPVS